MGCSSRSQKIDTSSAAGELVFHVFGAIAHFERRLISERTKDGVATARARGKRPGRQPLDMKKVEAAIKLVAAKTSPAEAARQLGLGRSTHLSGDEAVGYQSHCLTKIPLCSPLALCVEGSRVEGIWFGHAAHLECSRVSGLWCSHSC